MNSGGTKMIIKYLRILSSTFLVVALAAVISHAQVTTASFLGFVTDPGGAAISGAKVTATNEATGLTRTVNTNISGEYVISLLPVGRYTLTFEAPNFRQRAVKGLVLELAQKAKINATLEIGQITEVVTSEDGKDSPLARTETAEAGEVIENKRIVELPLNGRLFLQLAQLTPGVTTNPRGGFGEQLAGPFGPRITVMGARESDNYFTLDGVGITDRFYNTLTAPLSVEAIQEFKVQSKNYSAESGTFGGAQINIVIKSGTNDLHGSAFGFLRNDAFDARNFFDVAKPEFRQSQFGGTVGGPVIKNKAFFFGNYEGLRLAKALTRRFTVPTDSLRSGQFASLIRDPQTGLPCTLTDQRGCFTGNAIPDARISQVAKAILQFVPRTNLPGLSNNLVGSPQEINDNNQFTIRTDLRYGERDTAFARYTFFDVNAYQPYGFVQFATSAVSLPGFGIFLQQRSQNVAIGETHTFSSKLIGEFKFGFNRTAGGQYQQIQFNPVIASSKRGQFTFTTTYTGNAFADFLLGLPANARVGSGSSQVYLRGNEWQGFVQDDVKVSKRLTVNLGVRYEYASPLSEKFNRWATLDIQNRRVIVASEGGKTYPRALWVPGIEQQLAPLPIVTSEDAGLDRSLVNKDRNNFAPRIGFAFDLFGNQRTVIRTGYGIYYSSAPYNSFALQSLAAPFFKGVNANNSPTTPAPITTIVSNPLLGTPGWASYDINFRTPYYQQYNFGIQQLIMRDLLVEAQYLGSMGTKLHTNIFYNTPDPSPTTTPSVAARSLFPNLGNNSLQASAGNSNYNALALRAEKRLSFGLMVMSSYTFSKSIDTDSLANQGVSTNLDQSNIKAIERGRSTFDIRHRFVTSFTYDLPFKFGNKALNTVFGNWQAGGIITEQSGLPFTVNISGDRANNGLLNQRPNLVGDPNLPSGQRTPDRWFNTDAFVIHSIGMLGPAGRNILAAPGTNIVDFWLLKNIQFNERHRLQFRTEFFNLFNHTNFDFPERICAPPVVTTGASCTGDPATPSSLGRINAARDPRILQFALKYLF